MGERREGEKEEREREGEREERESWQRRSFGSGIHPCKNLSLAPAGCCRCHHHDAMVYHRCLTLEWLGWSYAHYRNDETSHVCPCSTMVTIETLFERKKNDDRENEDRENEDRERERERENGERMKTERERERLFSRSFRKSNNSSFIDEKRKRQWMKRGEESSKERERESW